MIGEFVRDHVIIKLFPRNDQMPPGLLIFRIGIFNLFSSTFFQGVFHVFLFAIDLSNRQEMASHTISNAVKGAVTKNKLPFWFNTSKIVAIGRNYAYKCPNFNLPNIFV